jgi:hypothetical protein
MMAFRKSTVSPPCPFVPGSCEADRLFAVLSRPIVRMTMTRAESELKQLAYERERALWRKAHPERESSL